MSPVEELPAADTTLRYLEAIFEELPIAAFVFDQDVRITDFNRAAFKLMDAGTREIADLLAGEALGCVHAGEVGGCGTRPDCRRCVLRNSVESTFATGQGIRSKGPMTLHRGGSVVTLEFVAATAFISVGDQECVLLTLQTLGERE